MDIGKRWVKKVYLHEEELIDNVNCVDINYKDGRYIVALSSYIWVCSLSEGSIITRLKGHKGKVTCLSYTKDWVYFYSGAIDGYIIKWSNVLEIVLKYQFDAPIQMLKINPFYDNVLICGENFYALWKNHKINVKKENLAKFVCCSWNQIGKLYALGLQSGIINIIDQKGETRFSFNRTGSMPNETIYPTTAMCWINDEIIAIGNAGFKLSFYNVYGHQVNKERSLDFVPYFIETIIYRNNNFSSFINYIVIGGSNGQWEIYNNEGIKITNYAKNFLAPLPNNNENAESNAPQRWPVTCCKPFLINDRLKIDETSLNPMPQLELDILLGYGDGELALFQLNFCIVIDAFLNSYALTENSTDVIVAELTSARKARIRCRDVVKGISLYHDTLGILTQSNKIIIYQSSGNKKASETFKEGVNGQLASSATQEAILHYKIVNRLTVDELALLNKDLNKPNTMLITTETRILLGHSRVYLAINYENSNDASRKISTVTWQNYRGDVDISATKKPKLTLATSITCCILGGGPPDSESILLATSDLKVHACSCNSLESFPFEIMDFSVSKSQCLINRLFINRPFVSKIACLDTNGTLSVFKNTPIEADDKFLYQENNVNSFCWCEDVSTMFCYVHSSGYIFVYDGTSRVYQVENYEKAIRLIQFSGETIYVIGDEFVDVLEIRVPLNDVVNHFMSEAKYKDALKYLNRCLYYRSLTEITSAKEEVNKEIYFELGKAALLELDFSTARTCLVHAKKYQHLNLLNDLQVDFKQHSDPSQVVKGYLAAFEGDFAGAAQVWKEVGQPKMSADMYCALGMFEKAKPFLASVEKEIKTSQNRADNHTNEPSDLDSFVQTAKLMVANGRYEIALDILVQHNLFEELIALANQLFDRAVMAEVGEPSQQLTIHFIACMEELDKAIPTLNITSDQLNQTELEALISLYEKVAFSNVNQNTLSHSPVYNAVAQRLYQYYSNLDRDISHVNNEEILGKLSKLVELYPDLFSAHQLHLNYAFAHLRMENLGLAVKEYGLAGVEKSINQILEDMITCDIEGNQFDQAGYHYFQLRSHLNKDSPITDSTNNQQSSLQNRDEIINENVCFRLAEIYYLYQKIYDYWLQPFTPHTSEEIFHMCRYLENALNSYENLLNGPETIKGVSKCLILTLYAKQALKVGCYSAAKRCVDSITIERRITFNTHILRTIENREALSLMPLKIGTKNLQTQNGIKDNANAVDQTINDSPKIGMDVVKSFKQSFFNQTARTILKSKCMQAGNISDTEDCRPFCYSCQTHTNFSENYPEADHTAKHDLFFPKCSVCGQPFICSFLSFDVLPLQYVGEEVPSDPKENGGDIFKVCAGGTTLCFRNVLPDMPLRQCSQCQKVFYAEEWELYLIQHQKCPFCRFVHTDIT